VAAFSEAVADHDIPASVLSDNGMVFTTRFAGGRAGRDTLNGFQTELRHLGVVQSIPSRPTHHLRQSGTVPPKPEEMAQSPTPAPQTVTELQALCDQFIDYYNTCRPHRSLNRRTPAAAYQARPKAAPTGSTPAEPQPRVRRDVIDSGGRITLRHNGRLQHIGVGRTPI
jgi:transposase InsO family protein